jgi:hypothetical protein
MMRSILASDRSDSRLHLMKVLEVLAGPELLAEITEGKDDPGGRL